MTRQYNDYKYGEFTLADGNRYMFCDYKVFVIKPVRDVYDEDWKTDIIQQKGKIPSGTELVVKDFFQNCYGEYIRVNYNGKCYDIKPSDCEYVKELKGD